MYLAGAFVALLLDRFAPHQETAWHGLARATQAPDAGRAPLWIINGFDEVTEATDLCPRLVVEIGQDVSGRSDVLGNLGPDPRNIFSHGARDKWGITECDLEVEVYGETRGEARLLADVVHNTLSMSRAAICAAFRLRDMTPVVNQRTIKTQDAAWRGAVTTRLFREDSWLMVPRAPDLRSVTITLNMADVVTQTNATIREVSLRTDD